MDAVEGDVGRSVVEEDEHILDEPESGTTVQGQFPRSVLFRVVAAYPR